jgi:hypothetical protein
MTTDPTAINIAIVEALGLDPTKIRKGGLRITLDEIGPVIEVTYHGHRMDDQRWEDVEAVLRRYKLTLIEDET